MYTRNRSTPSRAVYYGNGAQARPARTEEAVVPPPFYGGTAFARESGREITAEPMQPSPAVSVPPVSFQASEEPAPANGRPRCGEHARDDIEQMQGQPIPGLMTQEEITPDVPPNVRGEYRTSQMPIGRGRENGAHAPRNTEKPTAAIAAALRGLLEGREADDLLLCGLIVLFAGQNGDETLLLALIWLLLT